MNNSMKEAEDYINQIPLFGPHTEGRNKSGNENLEAVMALLGNPHLAHKAIHVAGTNGKGSTVQFLRAILTEEGYRVRTFTSPHLISITERIEGITEEEFVECYQIVRNACEHAVQKNLQHLSYLNSCLRWQRCIFQAGAGLCDLRDRTWRQTGCDQCACAGVDDHYRDWARSYEISRQHDRGDCWRKSRDYKNRRSSCVPHGQSGSGCRRKKSGRSTCGRSNKCRKCGV